MASIPGRARSFSPNSTFETVQDNVLGMVTHYKLGDPGSNPSRGEIFCTCPDKPFDTPFSFTVGSRSFLVEWLGCDIQPPPSSGKVQTSRAKPLVPFSAFMACYAANFTCCSLLCAA